MEAKTKSGNFFFTKSFVSPHLWWVRIHQNYHVVAPNSTITEYCVDIKLLSEGIEGYVVLQDEKMPILEQSLYCFHNYLIFASVLINMHD